MNNFVFMVVATSIISARLIFDMDFSNLSVLDYAVIVTAGVMWLMSGITIIKGKHHE